MTLGIWNILYTVIFFRYLGIIDAMIIPGLLERNHDNSFLQIPDQEANRHTPLVNYNKVKVQESFPQINTPKESITNEYIIVFKKSVADYEIQTHFKELKDLMFLNQVEKGLLFQSLHPFKIGNNKANINDRVNSPLNGYTLELGNDALSSIFIQFIQTTDIIDVIEKNSEIHSNRKIIQQDTPWGLSRISQRNRVKIGDKQDYAFDSGSIENNVLVNVYVLDTGVNINHEEFEGRASWGITVPDNDNEIDNNGHGTHCAGVIGSKTFGVAKAAKLIAVKILRSNGDGEMSDLIKGIEYVTNEHMSHISKQNNNQYRGSVINLSIGAGKSTALSLVIEASKNQGVHFAVAAGNEDEDACQNSPADSPNVITVGASGFSDGRAFFSNWGSCVDVFAPGVNVLSTFIGPNNNETLSLTGTSMATPYVTGLLAYFLSLQPESVSQYNVNNLISPESLKKKILNVATKDILFDVPEWTHNLLIFNGGGEPLKDFW